MSTIRATYVQHGSSAVPNITLNASGQVIVASGIVSSGTFAAPTGSAAAPGVYFVGDTNTGLYSPGADQVAVATNGVGRLFVNSNGDIGLGTSSPDVFGRFYTRAIGLSSSGSTSLQINSATGSTAIIDLGVNSSRTGGITSNVSQTNFSTLGATPLILETNSIERLRISSAGNVGIGTSSPATKIQIQHADATASVFRLSRDGDNATTFDIDYNSSSGHVTLGPTLSGSATAFNLGFKVAGSTRMQIDGSGRVGIGTTSPGYLTHLATGASATASLALDGGTDSGHGSVLLFRQGGTSKWFIGTDSTINSGTSDDLDIYTAGARALRIYTNNQERARIDSSGRLLVGTSSTSKDFRAVFQGNSADATGGANLLLARGTSSPADGSAIGYLSFTDSNHNTTAQIQAQRDGGTWTSGTSQPGRLVFSTTENGASSPTERMRITNAGEFRMFSGNLSYTLVLGNATTAGTSYIFLEGRHTATDNSGGTGTRSFLVTTNGNVTNTNGSYGTISDVKLKENIVNAGSQWNDFKAIQIRNWNFKAETGHETHRQIGPIAQELETVCPGLVFETPDRDEDGNETGEVTKGVNQSVLYMKAVKALQEAMERIETLEAKVAALETK
jgi:hypothetical protein